MTAYTDAAKIAAYLGITLTSDQQTQAGVVAQAASDWIDRRTGRTWQGTSVANELHTYLGAYMQLQRRPVAAISAVTIRPAYVGASPTTLTAGQGYELVDPNGGLVLVAPTIGSFDPPSTPDWLGSIVSVSYTISAAVPNDIALAATMIAAAWMTNTLQPDAFGIDSIAVGQNDVAVKFSAGATDVPPEAQRIVAGYRTIAFA